MTVRIRRARVDEYAVLGDIGIAAWANGGLGRMDGGRTSIEELRLEYVKFCRDLWQTIRVAEMSGHAVGWGARENGDQYISDLWICPSHQGRGIGGKLLGELETEIRTLGFGHAELETGAGNEHAIRFYQGHGYDVVWRGEKFSPPLGYAIDKVRMSKTL